MAALGVILLVALTAILVLFAPRLRSDGFWQRFAAPGPLTAAHEFMSTNCAGCHEPVAGVSPEQCIACHANDTSLLQRQPTAFHAYVGTCVECHREHDGPAALRAPMDHDALARIGLRLLASAPEDSEGRLLYSHLFAHGLANEALRAQDTLQTPTARERLLDCYGCHDRQDRHAGQFGRDCSSCHSTSAWTLPEYRHPPPSSTDCAQCHRAPPSHYMGHFEMVSKRVARVEHADVAQCYLCHQTTSWNDIKSVGMYDHH
jgi:hypothetical protein